MIGGEHRGALFDLAGRAIACEAIVLPEEIGTLIDAPRRGPDGTVKTGEDAQGEPIVYRTEIRGDDGTRHVVYSPRVPNGWLRTLGKEPLDEPVGVRGVFVKRVSGMDGAENAAPELLFVTRRLAWHPETLLGQLGMDVALFDDLAHNEGLSGGDAKCQFSLLRSVGNAEIEGLEELAERQQFEHQKTAEQAMRDRGQLDGEFPYVNEAVPSNSFILNDLRAKPKESAGRLVTFNGTALRAMRIEMKPADAKRYGFNHFFQVDCAVPLDPPITIERKKGGADGDGEIEKRTLTTMTVTFCVRELPVDFPMGERISEPIRAPGFFFKVWTANSTASLARSHLARDFYPIVVGHSLYWYETPVAENWIGVVAVCTVVGVIVLGGVATWVHRRGDRKADAIINRQRTVSEGSLNELGIEAEGKPDFAFLSRPDAGAGRAEAEERPSSV